jgi:hypothetical protein
MGIAGGSALGGVITQGAGPQITFLAAGALALTGAALGTLWRPKAPARRQHHPASIPLAAAAATAPENRPTGRSRDKQLKCPPRTVKLTRSGKRAGQPVTVGAEG